MSTPSLELVVLAHKHLYYNLATPVLEDWEFDGLQKAAFYSLPENSPANLPGIAPESKLPADVKMLAGLILAEHERQNA